MSKHGRPSPHIFLTRIFCGRVFVEEGRVFKPGLFFTDGNMTLEFLGIRERSVGPAGTMC